MPDPLASTSSRSLSRRRFLSVLSLGLAVTALLTSWKRLLPREKLSDKGQLRLPPGSMFIPRIKK